MHLVYPSRDCWFPCALSEVPVCAKVQKQCDFHQPPKQRLSRGTDSRQQTMRAPDPASPQPRGGYSSPSVLTAAHPCVAGQNDRRGRPGATVAGRRRRGGRHARWRLAGRKVSTENISQIGALLVWSHPLSQSLRSPSVFPPPPNMQGHTLARSRLACSFIGSFCPTLQA
jgi:hypothetical protein